MERQERLNNNWSEEENRLFQGAIRQHGQCWKTIRKIIKTRTIPQIRSHAQKYIPQWIKRLKLQHQQQNIPNERYSRHKNPAPAEFVPPAFLISPPIRAKKTKVQKIKREILTRNNQIRQENPAPQIEPIQLIAPQQNGLKIGNFSCFRPVPIEEKRQQPRAQNRQQRLTQTRIITNVIIVPLQGQLYKQRRGREQ